MANLRALKVPLLDSKHDREEQKEIKININTSVDCALAIPNVIGNIAYYLDPHSISSFLHASKGTYQLFNKIQPQKRRLFKDIRVLDESLERIDVCEAAIRAELSSTWMYKAAAHLSWVLPAGGICAPTSVGIYKLSEMADSVRVPDDGYPSGGYEIGAVVVGIVGFGLVACASPYLYKIYNSTFNCIDPANRTYSQVLSAETTHQVDEIEVKQGNETVRTVLADLNQLRLVQIEDRTLKLTQVGVLFFNRNSQSEEAKKASCASEEAKKISCDSVASISPGSCS